MDKNIYFDELYRQLAYKGLFRSQLTADRSEYHKYCQFIEISKDIWECVIKEYGNAFNNVIFVNSEKNILLNKCFFGSVNKKAARSAVYFSLLSCILDHCIDNGEPNKREEALYKLKFDYWAHYFIDFGKCSDSSVIDMLFYQTALGMKEIKEKNAAKYDHIIHLLMQTAEAEIYVSAEESNTYSEHKIIAKSVLFIQAAVEIATGWNNLLGSQTEVISAMGKAFALIDDICDYFEDIVSGQQNILGNILRTHDFRSALAYAVDEIWDCLEIIKKYTDTSFYSLINKEIRDWCINCPALRERILLYGKYNDNSKM